MNYPELARIMKEAHDRRLEGFNCAEGVFWGVSRGLALELPVSCVTGFGGGVVGSGSVCGALCGAIAAAGVYAGRVEPTDVQSKIRCDEICRAISSGFIDEMGTQLCREILGYMPGSQPKQSDGNQKKRIINPKCEKAVTLAIELALRQIKLDQCKHASPSNQSPLLPISEAD